jgi:hypothetical protein
VLGSVAGDGNHAICAALADAARRTSNRPKPVPIDSL